MTKSVLHKSSLSDNIADILRKRIMNLEMLPSSKINIQRLQNEFDVSSAPVREALLRLCNEGLVINETFKGFKVVKPSLEEIRQLFEVRLLVELFSIPYAIERNPVALINEIITQSNKLKVTYDKEQFYQLEKKIHESLIVESSGNPYFIGFYKSIRNQIDHLRHFNERVNEDLDEHRDILQSLLERDAERAKQELQKHITTARDKIISTIENDFYSDIGNAI